jgi:hypothetical protein
LKVGFLDTDEAGDPFDTLTFKILLGSSTVVNTSFGTLSAAQAYFQDEAVSLGAFSGSTTVDVQWALTSHTAGDMYDAQFVLADVAAVPEPSSVWLLVAGCVCPFALRRRK